MITFMKKFLNNNNNNTANNSNNNSSSRDRTCDSRSNPSSSSSSPFLPSQPSSSSSPSDHHHHHHHNSPYDSDDYYYYPDASKNPVSRPQHGVLQASTTTATTATAVESKRRTKDPGRSSATDDLYFTVEAKLLSASKTSNSCSENVRQNPSNLGDESVKENLSGAATSGAGDRRSPPPSGAPLYDSSPTMGGQASPDVCCCALCNKARQERRRMDDRTEADKSKTSIIINNIIINNNINNNNNNNNNYNNYNNVVVGNNKRTLREIPFKSNEAYENNEDDDDDVGGHVKNSNSFSANRRPEVLDEKHFESRNPFTIKTPSTFPLSKLEFSTAIRKSSTPPGDPPKTSPLTSFDPLNPPQSPHSPLSLPDGEEGNDIYRQRLNWLKSPVHREATSGDFKPPNVTIRHVEEVRFSPNSTQRLGGQVVSGVSS